MWYYFLLIRAKINLKNEVLIFSDQLLMIEDVTSLHFITQTGINFILS